MKDKHNLHCTCPQCGKTGMTVTEQAAFCNGKGQRLIGARSNMVEIATCQAVERIQLFKKLHRDEYFGHHPN